MLKKHPRRIRRQTAVRPKTIWRMAMRAGNRGPSVWPQCRERGVAAITYWPLDRTDLSQYEEGEPKELWEELEPAQRGFLRKVAYEMKPGDIIYVKEGGEIVGRGIVSGLYQFDPEGLIRASDSGTPFTHQVPVDWEPDFPPVKILLGSEPSTVLELKGERLRRLQEALEKAQKPWFIAPDEIPTPEQYKEGAIQTISVNYYERNPAARRACIEHYGFDCAVCEFNFAEAYGQLGEEYIHVHHLKDLATIGEEYEVDPIEDLRPVCPNCHAMLHHNRTRVLSIDQLRSIIARQKRRGRSTRTKAERGTEGSNA